MMFSFNSNMFEALKRNDLPCLKRSIAENANIEEHVTCGLTPMSVGSLKGHLDIVKYLVDMNANIETQNALGFAPLIVGCMKGHLDIVKYLVDMNANIETKDKRGDTLLIVGSMDGHLDIAKYLVDMKANIETQNAGGKTPPFLGSMKGHLDIVKYLVDMKANIEAKDRNGNTSYFLTHHGELKIFIKQKCIERQVQVFNRDLRDLYFLNTELKRALGAESVRHMLGKIDIQEWMRAICSESDFGSFMLSRGQCEELEK